MSLLEVEALVKTFGRRPVHTALDAVSLDLQAGEVVGVVGESGSGKSTLARIVCGLLEADGGAVTVNGSRLGEMSRRQLWSTLQLVPQDSYGSLNPVLSVRDIVAEPAHFHRGLSWAQARAGAVSMLDHVGFDPALADRYPTQLSGGQRQRVALARALAAEPKLLICDESTSALDVSVQAQILTLIERLQAEHGFGLLFVSHDISVVRYLAARILVMWNGQIVEQLDAASLSASGATHPYTRRLLAAVPTLPAEAAL